MTEKTVIFGGSFDPIHVGHLALAREVCALGLASEVWFMVSPQNPHKQGHVMTDENLRLKMVQLAIGNNPEFKACDFEFALPRPSYTIKTLEALECRYPQREFRLLIGADNWEKFDRWYKGDEILERYGVRVNFSVFECMLTPLQLKTIKSSIMPLLDVRSDSVVYYTICLNCYTKIEYQPPKKSNSKVIMVK